MHPASVELVGDLRDALHRSREGDTVGAVYCRQGDRTRHELVGQFRRQPRRKHGATGWQSTHQSTARDDQCRGSRGIQHTGGRAGSDLPHAVPQHHIGSHTVSGKCRRQGVLQGEQRGLGHDGVVERPAEVILTGLDRPHHRTTEVRLE
ncbi:Uncharacterised protein [Mycobacteroides abscessus subsp. abscessus]|nr:Uncharacterised protein [Mycobacteroides abscessus subsp. abscessus]